MLVRGVFFFSELAPAHPPLAFAVTPPGGLDGVLCTSAMDPGGFCFYVRRPFVVARYEAGKMPNLHGIEGRMGL